MEVPEEFEGEKHDCHIKMTLVGDSGTITFIFCGSNVLKKSAEMSAPVANLMLLSARSTFAGSEQPAGKKELALTVAIERGEWTRRIDALELQYLCKGLHVRKFEAMQPRYVIKTRPKTTQKMFRYFGRPRTMRRKNTRRENFPAQRVDQKRSI